MATFSNYVFDANSEFPPQIGDFAPSLSASNNSVIFLKTVNQYKFNSAVPKTIFSAPPLSATQVSSLTSDDFTGPLYSGWVSGGIPVGTVYAGYQVAPLTSVYASTNLLSSQVNTLTSAYVATNEFTSGTYNLLKTPVGVLFDQINTASTASVTLSVFSNISIKVAPEYNGATFALYFEDRTSTLFTVNTSTARQVATGAITSDNRGPRERRRFAIEI
jgi:hypothetical protein